MPFVLCFFDTAIGSMFTPMREDSAKKSNRQVSSGHDLPFRRARQSRRATRNAREKQPTRTND